MNENELKYCPEFRFIVCWADEPPPEFFAGQGHYQRGVDAIDALVNLQRKAPLHPTQRYVLDARKIPWGPGEAR